MKLSPYRTDRYQPTYVAMVVLDLFFAAMVVLFKEDCNRTVTEMQLHLCLSPTKIAGFLVIGTK